MTQFSLKYKFVYTTIPKEFFCPFAIWRTRCTFEVCHIPHLNIVIKYLYFIEQELSRGKVQAILHSMFSAANRYHIALRVIWDTSPFLIFINFNIGKNNFGIISRFTHAVLALRICPAADLHFS